MILTDVGCRDEYTFNVKRGLKALLIRFKASFKAPPRGTLVYNNIFEHLLVSPRHPDTMKIAFKKS
jgi:hypothetical protein